MSPMLCVLKKKKVKSEGHWSFGHAVRPKPTSDEGMSEGNCKKATPLEIEAFCKYLLLSLINSEKSPLFHPIHPISAAKDLKEFKLVRKKKYHSKRSCDKNHCSALN
jgi:hypothetical protein